MRAEATSERTGETPHDGQKHTTLTGTLTASNVVFTLNHMSLYNSHRRMLVGL